MNVEEPRFLTLNQVLRLHRLGLTRYGGTQGVRDGGLVESALASAQNTFFYGNGDWFDVAATYAFHLAESQASLDGNKRVAVLAAVTFLYINGRTVPRNTEVLHQAMIAVANKQLDKAGLAALLRSPATPRTKLNPPNP